MARRRSSARMQARPAPKSSGIAVMGLIMAAFAGLMILVLVIRKRQKDSEYLRRRREKQFVEDATELTNGLASLALKRLSEMKKPERLPDEVWAPFRSLRADGLVEAMILRREKMETKYLDGAFSRGTPPKLETRESSKEIGHDISMSSGRVTIGGETVPVRVFRKPVMAGKEEFLGTVILLMEEPER